MLDSSTLLIFAHRGEARAFLKYFEMTKYASSHLELYSNPEQDLFVLLTGEGVLDAMATTCAALGHLHNKIKKLVNIGIAGSIHPSIKKDQIHTIRTCYAQESVQKMFFKSYTLEGGEVDAVSASQRILHSKDCNYLQAFAPIVDRELWGVAKAAQMFALPLKSIKYISDEAWTQNEAQLCERMKEQAHEYSEQLLNYYLDHSDVQEEVEPELTSEFHSFYQLTGTHFTVSMKKKMNGLLKALTIKDEYTDFLIRAQEQIQKDSIAKIRPKVCAQNCLQLAQQMLMPFDHQVELALNKLATPFFENGIDVQFDPSREQSSFWIKTQIQHPKHLEKLRNAIDQFNYHELEKILQGQIDV